MTRDRSLDEFLGGERRDSADESDDDATDEPTPETTSDAVDTDSSTESGTDGDEVNSDRPEPGSAEERDETAVEPAVSTYEFSPDGAPCAACGAVVEKRWRDDGELVCPDCKAW